MKSKPSVPSSFCWLETLAGKLLPWPLHTAGDECALKQMQWTVMEHFQYGGEVWKHFNSPPRWVPFFVQLDHLHCDSTAFLISSTSVVD